MTVERVRSLANQQFAQRSALCDAQTGGVTGECVRLIAKPTAYTTIFAVRRSNTRCGRRTRTLAFQFATRSWLCDARTDSRTRTFACQTKSLHNYLRCATLKQAVCDSRTRTFDCQTNSLHYDRSLCRAGTDGVTAEHVRSLAKATVCTTICAVRRSNRLCDRRTRTFDCHTDSLHNDLRCATLEQAVWQANVYARLPNRQFAQRSWLCDARTGGVTAERVRSLAKPNVCARICAVRRSNRLCDSRTRTFDCHTDSLHNDLRCATLEQAVWQTNVYARLPNRQFAQRSWLCDARTGGVTAERVRSLAKPNVYARICAVRRSNRLCDSRTRTFDCHTDSLHNDLRCATLE